MTEVLRTIKSMDLAPAMRLSRRVYDGLERDWKEANDNEGRGVYRPGYSPQETEAIRVLAREAAPLGGVSYADAAGNVHILFEGEDKSRAPLMVGSHMDAVPKGGRYDGTAGLVAGLASIKALKDNGLMFPQDVLLTTFRAEESAWWSAGTACIGSKLISGGLTAKFLEKAKMRGCGETLYTKMQEIDVDAVELAITLKADNPVFPLDKIGEFIEVHIEQGPTLLEADKSLGILTDIRGNVRFPEGIVFKGKAAHSGATPQHIRKDAAVAAAKFVVRWYEEMERIERAGKDIVFAVPDICVLDASPTSVAAQCRVQPEVRTTDPDIVEQVANLTKVIAKQIAEESNVDVEIEAAGIVTSAPVKLDQEIHESLMGHANALEIDVLSMPSGAGHDAGVLASAGVPAGMIFIRHGNEGISHNPDEILSSSPERDPFSLGSSFSEAVRLLSAKIMEPQERKQEQDQAFRDHLVSGNFVKRFIL